jgi:pyrroloquinoline quinone biosynthesis protein B
VLLSDAEFDHTIGLLVLREGSRLTVYATAAVLNALAEHFPVARLLSNYADLHWQQIEPGRAVSLDERLQATPFVTGRKRPRYVTAGHGQSEEWVVGYRLEDPVSGGVAVYAPAVLDWDAGLARQMSSADCVFLDGTFWTDDEMLRTGTGKRGARQMGHMPISGEDGSAVRLARLPARRKVYIHINNTNPVLDETSAERRQLAELGIEIGGAGWEAGI